MGAFTEAEMGYLLSERRLARIATVGKDGTPHVTPVGYTYNSDYDTIDVGGRNLMEKKKFADVARSGRAAIVIDDMVSQTPFHVRGLEVRGRAEAISDPEHPLIRIFPERIISWGIVSAVHDAHSVPKR